MYSFRVFLSYARSDTKHTELIAAQLRDRKLVPILDKDISPGRVFTDEIRKGIAQAHLFMPLLTAKSCTRPWVHQEVGYALGIDVPVLPVSIGSLPEGMLSGVQVISVKDDLSNFGMCIDQTNIESLVQTIHGGEELERLGITTHVAGFGEDRTDLLVRSIREIHQPAAIRQRGIFSSFSLPDLPPENDIWESIELPERRSHYLRKKLKAERESMERHACSAGCSLILYPFVDYEPVGVKFHRTQLNLLRDFLVSKSPEQVVVATKLGTFPGNVTIVGDWFGAKALPPQGGSEYRQTVFLPPRAQSSQLAA